MDFFEGENLSEVVRGFHVMLSHEGIEKSFSYLEDNGVQASDVSTFFTSYSSGFKDGVSSCVEKGFEKKSSQDSVYQIAYELARELFESEHSRTRRQNNNVTFVVIVILLLILLGVYLFI